MNLFSIYLVNKPATHLDMIGELGALFLAPIQVLLYAAVIPDYDGGPRRLRPQLSQLVLQMFLLSFQLMTPGICRERGS